MPHCKSFVPGLLEQVGKKKGRMAETFFTPLNNCHNEVMTHFHFLLSQMPHCG